MIPFGAALRALVVLLPVACAGRSPSSVDEAIPAAAGPTSQTLLPTVQELAADGTYDLEPFASRPLDANARVRIAFPRSSAQQALDAAVVALNDLAARSTELLQLRADINARVAALGPAPLQATVDALIVEQQRADERIDGLLKELAVAIGGEESASDVVLGVVSIPGAPARSSAYERIVLWTRHRIEQITAEARAVALAAPKTLVTITATLHHQVGGATAMHVPGYDKLPDGELQTISRLGLTMTDAERKVLRAGLDTAEKAKAAVRDADAALYALRESARKVAAEMRTAAQALSTIDVPERIDEGILELQKQVAGLDPGTERERVASVLKAALTVVQGLGQLQQRARNLADGLSDANERRIA